MEEDPKERELPVPDAVDAGAIQPLAPEGDPEVKKGRRGDPEDTSLEPSDQTDEAVTEDGPGDGP